jgi:hypothetical protein
MPNTAERNGFNDKKGGYPSGSKPVSQLPRIPLRDRVSASSETPPDCVGSSGRRLGCMATGAGGTFAISTAAHAI